MYLNRRYLAAALVEIGLGGSITTSEFSDREETQTHKSLGGLMLDRNVQGASARASRRDGRIIWLKNKNRLVGNFFRGFPYTQISSLIADSAHVIEDAVLLLDVDVEQSPLLLFRAALPIDRPPSVFPARVCLATHAEQNSNNHDYDDDVEWNFGAWPRVPLHVNGRIIDKHAADVNL